MTNYQRYIAIRIAAAIAVMLSLAAQAADPKDAFPNRTIKMVVGFAAGGSSDTVGRILAQHMTESMKQSVLIDNKPGAGGNIASEFLIKAPADGYTIMLGTIGSLAVNQHLKKLAYNPATDTAPVTMAVIFSNILVVNAASDIKTFDDYLRQGKVEKSMLSFGSSGVGGSGHLAGELLKSQAGLSTQHIAYRGGAPAMNDLLGGSLPSIFTSPTDALQFIQQGKLRALATTGAKRLDALPNVPTIAELGFPGFEAINWYAFVAPKGTPPDIVARLNKAIVVALADQGIAAQLRKLGLDPYASSPADADRFIRAESEKWGALARKIDMKAD